MKAIKFIIIAIFLISLIFINFQSTIEKFTIYPINEEYIAIEYDKDLNLKNFSLFNNIIPIKVEDKNIIKYNESNYMILKSKKPTLIFYNYFYIDIIKEAEKKIELPLYGDYLLISKQLKEPIKFNKNSLTQILELTFLPINNISNTPPAIEIKYDKKSPSKFSIESYSNDKYIVVNIKISFISDREITDNYEIFNNINLETLLNSKITIEGSELKFES